MMMNSRVFSISGRAGFGWLFAFGLAHTVLLAPVSSQTFTTDPGRFGAMTCQQLWYLEQKTLAEGRVCPSSERAKRAFRRADRCISSSEAILPNETQDYLTKLRNVARGKGCAGF